MNNEYYERVKKGSNKYLDDPRLSPPKVPAPTYESVLSMASFAYANAQLHFRDCQGKTFDEADLKIFQLAELFHSKLSEATGPISDGIYNDDMAFLLKEIAEGIRLGDYTNFEGFSKVAHACGGIIASSIRWLERFA
jgi:hypothetical protein